MGNTIDWGQAAVNNTIGFGDGAENNTIGWGDIQADSWSPETNLTGTGSTPAWSNTLSTTFDGVDDYVDIGSPASLNLSTISISAWIKTTNNGNIVGSDDQSLGRRFIFQILISGELRFYYWNTSSVAKNIVSTTTLNDGNWHHVMAINNGTDLKLYIDGTLDNSSLDGGNIKPYTSTPIHIGDRSYASSRGHFNGSIDEVAIWSSDQSANASAIGSTVPTDLTSYNPLGWWRMGDGSTYPTINDEIGSNNGTMNNMTSANFVTDVPT